MSKEKKTKKEKKSFATMSAPELLAQVKQLESEIFKLRMQLSTGQLANTATLKFTRKDLARAKTAQSQKLSAAK